MFTFDKRFLYIIMAIIIIRGLMPYFTDVNMLIGLLISLPAVLIAITFHEFAHAFAADKLGDDTPRRQGRLNLNPFKHLDPFGTIMLIFAGFGWGKPVQINPRNFNRDMPMKKAEAIVAAAGPIMNFILAILFTIINLSIIKFFNGFYNLQIGMITVGIIENCVIVNLGLGIFNLIPLPPLDGSKILSNFLPYKAREWFESREQIFYIIFVAIWVTGLAGTIISPLINEAYRGLTYIMAKMFKII